MVSSECFYGFEVLGTLAIDDAATQDEIVAVQARRIADNLDQEAAACFAPRAMASESYTCKVHEFVICFECEITTWYVDGSQAGSMYPTNVAQPEIDRVLKMLASACRNRRGRDGRVPSNWPRVASRDAENVLE